MTKTDHYQLPQWEARDPIHRGDFNQAMSTLDGALGATSSGLLRLAEWELRRRYAAMDQSVLTQEEGLLLNPLSTAEMAAELGGPWWDGGKKIYSGRGPELSRTFLRDYCTSFSNGYLSKSYNSNSSSITSLYEFTVPYDVVVRDFDLLYTMSFSTTNTAFTGGSLTFTAYENVDGSYVSIYEKTGITLELTGTSLIKSGVTIPVEVPLKKGAAYRFSLHLDSGQGVTGRFGFVVSTSDGTDTIDDSAFTVVPVPVTVGSHQRTVPLRDMASLGVVLVSWRQEEAQGGVSVALDGLPMTQVDRQETACDGYTEVESVFHGAGVFRDAVALTVTLRCGETDELRLTGYGVMLL